MPMSSSDYQQALVLKEMWELMNDVNGRIARVLVLNDQLAPDSRLLPPQFQQCNNGNVIGRNLQGQQTEADCALAVSDYIAGMTDRYAIREHRRIFAVEEIQI